MNKIIKPMSPRLFMRPRNLVKIPESSAQITPPDVRIKKSLHHLTLMIQPNILKIVKNIALAYLNHVFCR
jgi:hypothetical protein